MSDVDRLWSAIKTAFLQAVNLENPCPFCLARTSNVWPFCVHFKPCIVEEILPPDIVEMIRAQPRPDVCGEFLAVDDMVPPTCTRPKGHGGEHGASPGPGEDKG